jgi:ABC-type phosphate transport system, periplasmic component
MKRRLINLFALLACTAVVFGCSSSEDSSSSSPETASASESVEEVGSLEGTVEDSSSSSPETASASESVEEVGSLEGTVEVSGSSTVEPVSVRVAELFEDVAPGVAVNVDGPGTGDGFELFCNGKTNIFGASRAI